MEPVAKFTVYPRHQTSNRFGSSGIARILDATLCEQLLAEDMLSHYTNGMKRYNLSSVWSSVMRSRAGAIYDHKSSESNAPEIGLIRTYSRLLGNSGRP